MKRTTIATVLGLVMLSSGVAEAGTITTFTDRAAFDASVGPTTIDTFGTDVAFPISTGVLDASTNLVTDFGGPILPGRVQPGVTYSTPLGSGFFFNIDLGGGFESPFLDGGLPSMGQNPLTVSFANPVLAFGFDTNGLMGTTFEVMIVFSSGTTFTGVNPLSASLTPVFFGFQSSDDDIVSVRILGTGGRFDFAVDNFSVAADRAVPEPSAVFLTTMALLALAIRRRSVR